MNYLKNGGYLAFEVGYNQGETVSQLMEKMDFKLSEERLTTEELRE